MAHRSAILSAALLLAVPALASFPRIASAEAFKYVDDAGRVRFTDNLSAVPPKYRDQVETRKTAAPASSRSSRGGRDELDGMERFLVTAFAAIVEDDGDPLTYVERRAVEDWAADWGWAALWASALSTLIMLGLVVHAFAADRKLWGVANFILGFTTIPYLFIHVEQPMAIRLGMLLGTCAPVPLFYALFARLVATV